MKVVGKLEICNTVVVFPGKGIREGAYRKIVGTNYGEIKELSKDKGHAKGNIQDLNIQKNIPL